MCGGLEGTPRGPPWEECFRQRKQYVKVLENLWEMPGQFSLMLACKKKAMKWNSWLDLPGGDGEIGTPVITS